ncbi:MAG: type II toxin-antitoxin system RelE/ParE family toxin [Kiritimatiellae bacterium]|jgi:mRNA interferase RelE/StbE|nr:type II toxin-antitoxin system RelE/ParE family toxin [Kiritimatiellia bacterium]
MNYTVEIKPKAIKDAKRVPKNILSRIFDKIDIMSFNLSGDVKKLTNFTPEYRLRVGEYRILFEVEDNKIIVYRILHRKDVYR